MAGNYWELISDARAKRKAEEFEAAIAAYDETIASIQAETVGAEAYFERGLARRAVGNLQGAIEDYENALPRAVGAQIQQAQIHLFKGCAYAALGSDAEARTAFDGAMQTLFRPQSPNDCEFLIINESLGKAVEDISLLLGRDSQCVPAYFCRGLLKRNLKDWAGAIADYQAAVNLDSANARLAEWAFAQDVLQNGTPNSYNAYRPHLRADLQYCTFDRQMDTRTVLVTHFDIDSKTEASHPGTEEAGLREQMLRDGWTLVKSGNHQEGGTLTFARRRS
jgi:tetratricopeptide (TPR) repeat protein